MVFCHGITSSSLCIWTSRTIQVLSFCLNLRLPPLFFHQPLIIVYIYLRVKPVLFSFQPTLENSCGDWGRIYDFENSWDLSNVNNGVVCAARRLYTAFGARANNVGAAATSAATDAAISIISEIEDELVSVSWSKHISKYFTCFTLVQSNNEVINYHRSKNSAKLQISI